MGSVDLKSVIVFNEYLDVLLKMKNIIIIATAKDTLVPGNLISKITKDEYNKLNMLGFKELSDKNVKKQFWSGYIGISVDKVTAYEKLSEKDECIFYFSNELNEISILSSPLRKRNKSSVIFNGREISVDRRGLNIVVISNENYKVLDSVSFDTWNDKSIRRLILKDEEGKIDISQRVRTATTEKINKMEEKMKKMEEKSETLLQLLKVTIDPAKLPSGEGDLRHHQLGCVALLRLFCSFLDEKKISYWLNAGTLIGALRGGKFIPWDDDIDISMDRINYEKLRECIGEFCSRDFSYSDGSCIRIFYKNSSAQVDVIPFDYGNSTELPEGKEYEKMTQKLQSLYEKIPILKTFRKNNITDEYKKKIPEIYKREILENKEIPEGAYMFPAFHCYMPKRVLYRYDVIFPLKKIKFEGYYFSAPNDPYTFLHGVLGDYMTLPAKLKDHGMGKNMTLDNHEKLQELIEMSNKKLG